MLWELGEELRDGWEPKEIRKKKHEKRFASFLPRGHGDKRILVYMICLTNICMTLSDKANKF